MTLILNILWFIFGGFLAGLSWMLAALLLAITIIGLPWAGAAWRIGMFSFAPFGKMVADRRTSDLGTGCIGFLLNVIWFVLGGWYIAIAHVVLGAALFVTIIGIPFAIQHFKLAIISLAPIGRDVVTL